MKTYILKSWFTDKVVYKSDNLFYSDNELWNDISEMKCQYHGTYAEIIRR